jgi:hypothetical protein
MVRIATGCRTRRCSKICISGRFQSVVLADPIIYHVILGLFASFQ